MNTKLLTLAALLMLLTATVNGLYNPNQTNDTGGDGQMSITSHGDSGAVAESAGGSGATSEANGTEWRAQIMTENRVQNASNTGTLTNVSWHDTEDGMQKAKFTGVIALPTPCHAIGQAVEKTDDGYTLTITTYRQDTDKMCAQVVTPVRYSAWFATDAPYTLTVQHGDTTVDTLQSPEPAEDPSAPSQPNRQSVFGGLWNWLTGLF